MKDLDRQNKLNFNNYEIAKEDVDKDSKTKDSFANLVQNKLSQFFKKEHTQKNNSEYKSFKNNQARLHSFPSISFDEYLKRQKEIKTKNKQNKNNNPLLDLNRFFSYYDAKINYNNRFKNSLVRLKALNEIKYEINPFFKKKEDILALMDHITKKVLKDSDGMPSKTKENLKEIMIEISNARENFEFFPTIKSLKSKLELNELEKSNKKLDVLNPYLLMLYKINNEAFNLELDLPNTLIFKRYRGRTFGKYIRSKDQIIIDERIKNDEKATSFILYHEMLHKKFHSKIVQKRMIYHSKEFKKYEKKHPYYDYTHEHMKKLIKNKSF